MGEYKPVSPVQLEIDEFTIPTYISVFDALKLDEGVEQMTITYDATRGVWTVVLANFETTGLLEFMANVHMELPHEVEKPEDVWEITGDGPIEQPPAHVEHAVVFTEAVETADDREVDDPGYLEDAAAEEEAAKSRKVVLKRANIVQKSGAISVEED